MDCGRAQELLGAQDDDPQLAEHLAGCEDCAGAAAAARLASRLPLEELPEDFESRLRMRLACVPARPRRSRNWVAAGLAGALVAAGLGAVMLARPQVRVAHPAVFSEAAPAASLERAAVPRAAAALPSAVRGAAATANRPAAGAVAHGVAVPSPMPAQSAATAAVPVGGRKVIQQARVTLRVADVRRTFDTVQTWVAQSGGYVGSSSFSVARQEDRASLELRLPADRIGALLTQLRGMGKVTAVSQSGRDVTAQYVDLGARLTALQAEERAYLRLLSQAKTISDTLQLEQQLTQVRSQIDSIGAQRRQLGRLAALATVQLQILPAVRPAGALQASWRTFLSALRAIGLAAVWVLPWALLAGALAAAVLGVRSLWRR